MASKRFNLTQQFSQKQLLAWLARVLAVLSTRAVRLFIAGVFIFVAAYFIYARAWLVLQEEAPLPAGVSPTNPTLNTQLLQDINNQRVDRVSRPVGTFNVSLIFRPNDNQ